MLWPQFYFLLIKQTQMINLQPSQVLSKKLIVKWTQFQKSWGSKGSGKIAATAWAFFWMQFTGLSYLGRLSTWLATWFVPPYKGRRHLARYHSLGYIAASATVYGNDLRFGPNIFIGDRVLIFQNQDGGSLELAERVHLYNETCIEIGLGGSVKIGADTHIQPRCQFSAYKAPIQVGSGVQIAPNCAFYPYSHSLAPGTPIRNQPLQTKGGILIDDDVWLGYGVIVLDGVHIGKGAVIGAGAVVTHNIPAGAIAVGVPAQVVKTRPLS